MRLTLIALVCVSISGGMGVWVGKLLNHRQEDNYRESRKIATASLLEHMGTLHIGTRLSDAVLLDVKGAGVQLSAVVHCSTIVFFLDPECGTCLAELDNLYRFGNTNNPSRRLLIVTRSMIPVDEWIDLNRLPYVAVLRDPDGSYHANLNIVAVPFTLLVDGHLNIVNAYSGIVTGSEIEQFLSVHTS